MQQISWLTIRRYIITIIVAVIAIIISLRLWQHYEHDPWTRDGRVKADVVQIAPDVSGQVEKILVKDNEKVRKGQILFEIDSARFALALREAQANELDAKTSLAQYTREAKRNSELKELVSKEEREKGNAKVEQAKATLAKAIVNRDTALLNLERTKVYSTVNGRITNLNLQVGSYVTTSHPVVALVDTDSIYVEGYFEETKVPGIREGDKVTISLMGEDRPLEGHIASVAMGIYDRERSTGSNLLQNINPALNWIRLVQRIPVRIALDSVPEDVRLIMGQTATIEVHIQSERKVSALVSSKTGNNQK